MLFVLVLIAGITLKASWLPRVIAASLALSLLAGAIANPDRYVAQQNVNRYVKTGQAQHLLHAADVGRCRTGHRAAATEFAHLLAAGHRRSISRPWR